MIRRRTETNARCIVALFFLSTLVACQMPAVKTADRNRPTTAKAKAPTVVSQDAPVDAPVAPTNVQTSAPKTEGRGQTGVLLAYQVFGNVAMVPGGGCRLKLENVKTQKDVFLTLKKEHTAVFKDIPPGRYFGTRLSCGATRIWNLNDLFGPGFDVEAGRVSYVGKILFEFNQNDLASFKQATRLESQRALRDATGAMPIGSAESLVAGFTMKPITNAIIESEGPEAFDVYAKGTQEPDKTLEDLMGKLRRCSVNVAKDDPLRIGHLTLVATFKAGAFADVKEKSETHALSENFVTCVDNSLRTFKPPVANDLEIRVRF